MPYQNYSNQQISWANNGCWSDYNNAEDGTVFLGVLDTTTGRVYIAPSDTSVAGRGQGFRKPVRATPKQWTRRKGGQIKQRFHGIKHKAAPQFPATAPTVPAAGWQTIPAGAGAGINSLSNDDWNQAVPQHQIDAYRQRQHGRLMTINNLQDADCIGFALMKIDHKTAHYLDRSNTCNAAGPGKPIVPGTDGLKRKDTGRVSPHSGSARIPQRWNEAVMRFFRANPNVKIKTLRRTR